MYSNITNIWWQQVSDAVFMMNRITARLTDEKSIALVLPEHTPWYSFFINQIEKNLHNNNSDNSFCMIDVSDISSENPGKYIAGRYCSGAKLSEYWPGESYARFLAKSNDIILNNQYLWIKGLDSENYKNWYNFVNEYIECCDENEKRASFILEYRDDENPVSMKSPLFDTVCWNEVIKPYDYYMFSSLMVSSLSCCDEIKHYIAELIYTISRNDAELCAVLAGYGEKFAENPDIILHKCISDSCRSDGSAFSVPDLNCVDTAVRETQIKKVFPVIERFRNRFITENYNQLDYFLPIENTNRELISEPYELEIGTLKFISGSKNFAISEKQKNELSFIHNARNRLAHNKILSYNEVGEILNIM